MLNVTPARSFSTSHGMPPRFVDAISRPIDSAAAPGRTANDNGIVVV